MQLLQLLTFFVLAWSCVHVLFFIAVKLGAKSPRKHYGFGSTYLDPFATNRKGSIAGRTFMKWKGRNVEKAKMGKQPGRVFTNNQIKQQAFMRILNVIWDNIFTTLQIGFRTRAQDLQISEWNVFASDINQAAKGGVAPAAVLIPASLIIAKGTMSNTPIATLTADLSDDTVIFTWLPDLGLDQTDDDLAYMVCFNATRNTWSIQDAGFERADTNGEVALPALSQVGDVISCWLFFTSPDGVPFISSDSVYGTDAVAA